jgi:hypothetical protein
MATQKHLLTKRARIVRDIAAVRVAAGSLSKLLCRRCLERLGLRGGGPTVKIEAPQPVTKCAHANTPSQNCGHSSARRPKYALHFDAGKLPPRRAQNFASN